MMRGKPLERPAQITDKEAIDRALTALVYGGDEPLIDTSMHGRGAPDQDEEDRMWNEELQQLDALISEEVGENPSPLPSTDLVEQINHLQDKLWTWFASPIPRWERRILRESLNELASLGGAVNSGKVPTVEAQERFDAIYAEVANILEWTKFTDV